ncbi:cytochrome c [Salinarimonas sp.]|uniref:c-type cytochrome n=1 Tax=Salinarimonas sp. TaxID=2766526 RepID=UPI0032D95E0E
MRGSIWGGVVAGALAVLVVAGIVGLVVVYTGAYNVAATEQHASFTRWAFDTTFRNSVESRAADVPVPETISAEVLATGAAAYKDSCQHCHAGPGVERADWASGMRPRPPHLAEVAAEWEMREIYWLVENGVKMSGMPAFGPSHDSETIWGIAAFVKELPALTPEDYAQAGAAETTGSTGRDEEE